MSRTLQCKRGVIVPNRGPFSSVFNLRPRLPIRAASWDRRPLVRCADVHKPLVPFGLYIRSAKARQQKPPDWENAVGKNCASYYDALPHSPRSTTLEPTPFQAACHGAGWFQFWLSAHCSAVSKRIRSSVICCDSSPSDHRGFSPAVRPAFVPSGEFDRTADCLVLS